LHQGLDRALALFQASALLELGLDTTDGSGACLSWPLVNAAAALLTDIADGDDNGSQPAGMEPPPIQSLYDPSSPTIPGLL
jgi:nicotinate-nucleotide--dimethylbenzimidazole phosphoribosyltransferase